MLLTKTFFRKSFINSHDALLSISEQKYIESEDRLKSSNDFCFKDNNEMLLDFQNFPDAIENTVKIAKKCSFFLQKNHQNYPDKYRE